MSFWYSIGRGRATCLDVELIVDRHGSPTIGLRRQKLLARDGRWRQVEATPSRAKSKGACARRGDWTARHATSASAIGNGRQSPFIVVIVSVPTGRCASD